MSSLRLLTVVGNRPQFIKAAVISRAIASHNMSDNERLVQETIIHTGQHYDANMSAIFFREMAIPEPSYHLGICDCSHGSMTGRMLEAIETVLQKEKPTVVIVYGDTNSTLAGALAAAKLKIPVAHVEAGLRSFNMNMPEEINRVLTDRISHFLFCPTQAAVGNLHREGVPYAGQDSVDQPIIVNVGDVMYDAALFYRQIARPTGATVHVIHELEKKFYLATVHRAENTDDPKRLRAILEAFSTISQSVPIVLPMHPRTKKVIEGEGLLLNGVRVMEPVGYFDMLTLLDSCQAVFTDSGGLQKEAFFFQKPCIVLRDETEWVELVEHGFAMLAGADKDKIMCAEKSIAAEKRDYTRTFYGTGNAGTKIVQSLLDSVMQIAAPMH